MFTMSATGSTSVGRVAASRGTIEETGPVDLGVVARAILDTSDTMVVLTDTDGTILYVNPAFTAVTGYAAEEAIGGNPRLLRSGVHDRAFYADLWDTILDGEPWHGEIVNRRKDGTLYTDEMTIVPLGMKAGRPTHFLAVKRDVSSRLEALTSSSPVGLAHADRAGRLQYVNVRAEELLGGTFPDLVGHGWLSRFTVHDRGAIMRLLEAEDADRDPSEDLIVELGADRVVSIRVAPLIAAGGDRLGLVVSFEDVTDQTRTRAQLIERERFTRGILDAMSDPTAVVAADGSIIGANATWIRSAELNGGSADACGVGANYLAECRRAAADGCEDGARVADALDAILAGRQAFFEMEYACPSPTEDRWFLERITPLAGFDAAVLAHIDITWRKHAERRLSFVATHDPLTGVLNRAAFDETLAAAFEAREANGDTVGVLFVDLDGFKSVNDTLGHAAGDVVLARTAERLRRVVRARDSLVRVGGDEFVVVLASADARVHAPIVAARIEQILAEPFDAAGAPVHLGASVGIAYARPEDTPTSLLERADARMYRAKKQHQVTHPTSRSGSPG